MEAPPNMKTVLVILLLSVSALSQQPSREQPVWNWSDAALGGAMVADEASTAYALNRCTSCREGGLANPGLRMGIKAGVFGFFKAWEYKKPEDRRKIRWVKLAFSGLFVGVAIHNMNMRSKK
jgi:hypothetical protein